MCECLLGAFSHAIEDLFGNPDKLECWSLLACYFLALIEFNSTDSSELLNTLLLTQQHSKMKTC